MNGPTLLRLLRRLATARGWAMTERPGKGSHVVIALNGRRSVIALHRADMPKGTFRAVLKQLDLDAAELEE
jgi:predicted RNA binding protein YcfA (HicA-like mRNA interferase family)